MNFWDCTMLMSLCPSTIVLNSLGTLVLRIKGRTCGVKTPRSLKLGFMGALLR